jgi:trehalose 6-phosphate phosphatase
MVDSAPFVEALAPLLADPARGAVLLDVDGTLAPIVRHADDAHVPDSTRTPLIAVARRYGLVACVSGRRAAVARRIVSLGSINYVGNHGAEILRGGAVAPETDAAIAAWGPRVQEFAASAMTAQLRTLRVRFEDKDVIAAFHWRGAPDEEAAHEALRALALSAQSRGFAVHWGRKVLEVRPDVPIDKGRGVTKLLREVTVDSALYVGDDRTDVDAFTAMRALVARDRLVRALCIGVRSDETPAELEAAADLLVDGPVGVRRLLEMLAAEKDQ